MESTTNHTAGVWDDWVEYLRPDDPISIQFFYVFRLSQKKIDKHRILRRWDSNLHPLKPHSGMLPPDHQSIP